MKSLDERKIVINKISLIFNIILVITTIVSLLGTPIFKSLFIGKLSETKISSEYPEKYHGISYYSIIFKYKHITGECIHDTSLLYKVENTGAKIDKYNPYFYTLFNKREIRQYSDEGTIKIEIPLIREKEEFSIILYSKNRAKISSTIFMKDGKLLYEGSNDKIRSPFIWVSGLIVVVFLLIISFCKKIINQMQSEKERIIKERNDLQNIIMEKKRLTSIKFK